MTADVVALRRVDYITVGESVDAFLAAHRDTPNTARAYRTALTMLVKQLGELDPDVASLPLVDLESAELIAAVTALWGGAAPSTWNQRTAVVRSYLGYARTNRWLAGAQLELETRRKREQIDETRAIPADDLERFWAQELPLREKTFTRMLYESCARASEILNLNVEDLDMPNRRAPVTRKGGKLQIVHWQTSTARLLPRLLGGRRTGPLYLAHTAPVASRAPALVDVDVLTGRGRLSYNRAERLFKELNGGRWTLHQLRHSALTHRSEAGVDVVELMGMSGHASVRSLARYARPSADAIGRRVQQLDPAARRVTS